MPAKLLRHATLGLKLGNTATKFLQPLLHVLHGLCPLFKHAAQFVGILSTLRSTLRGTARQGRSYHRVHISLRSGSLRSGSPSGHPEDLLSRGNKNGVRLLEPVRLEPVRLEPVRLGPVRRLRGGASDRRLAMWQSGAEPSLDRIELVEDPVELLGDLDWGIGTSPRPSLEIWPLGNRGLRLHTPWRLRAGAGPRWTKSRAHARGRAIPGL